MKTVIAGGRDYILSWEDLNWLDTLGITHVVSGGAIGADLDGENWARTNYLPMTRIPANWDEHGRAAGPIRNRQMAEIAEAVVLFPGGRGTASMRREAKRAGIPVFEREIDE